MRFSGLLAVAALLFAGCGEGTSIDAPEPGSTPTTAATPDSAGAPAVAEPDPAELALKEAKEAIAGLKAAQKAFIDKYNAADAATKKEMRSEYPRGEDVTERMTALAEEFKSSEAGAVAHVELMWNTAGPLSEVLKPFETSGSSMYLHIAFAKSHDSGLADPAGSPGHQGHIAS